MLASRTANENPDQASVAEKQDLQLANSERIRTKFGSYGIDIIENSPDIRVSSLYSLHDGSRVSRTFAVVAYPEVIEPAFQKEHEAIINGESIGILFKDNGWTIGKHHQYFGEIETPPGYFIASPDAGDDATTRSAIHVYFLMVKKGDSEFQYASIAEVHHPEFLNLQDLALIYGAEFETHLEKKDRVGDFLDVIESRIRAL